MKNYESGEVNSKSTENPKDGIIVLLSISTSDSEMGLIITP